MSANCCEQCAEFDKNPGHDGKDGDCLSPWNLTEIKIPGRDPNDNLLVSVTGTYVSTS